MFAYCGNEPVIATDHSGNRYVSIDISDGGGTHAPEPDYIENQTDFEYSNLPMGFSLRTGFVTVADSGCGLVAAYNILVSRGINVSFRDIYAYALKNHMLKTSGLAVYQTLRIIFDFDPTVTDADDEFNAQSSLIIYSYAEAYGGGAHIVAAINRGSGNYDFYNDSFYPRNIIGYPISYRDYYTSVKRSGYLAPDDPEKPNMFCILIY